MASIAELLENELVAALDVKDTRSLHNYVTIVTELFVKKEDFMSTSGSMQSDVRVISESLREGFRRMDERFEAMDKRFEAVDKRFEASDKRFDDLLHYMDKRFEDLIGQMNSRFTMMFFFMSAGFTILTVLMTLYRFVG